MNGEQADFPFARSRGIEAEAHGDPSAAIDARLFATRPEVERLFVTDRMGLARGVDAGDGDGLDACAERGLSAA